MEFSQCCLREQNCQGAKRRAEGNRPGSWCLVDTQEVSAGTWESLPPPCEPRYTGSPSQVNKQSSAGVDGHSWQTYEQVQADRSPKLLSAFKGGSYKAPPVRRVYIPKGGDGQRPLGIPTIEDKILQESVRRTLTPIYEEAFKDFSFGFREGRSAHQAIEYMFKEVSW